MGILSWLWDEPPQAQVRNIEQQEPSFEQRLERIVKNSHGLNHKSESERQQLIEDVREALDIIEGAIDVLAASDLAERAKRTRTKLRAIRTRAQRAA